MSVKEATGYIAPYHKEKIASSDHGHIAQVHIQRMEVNILPCRIPREPRTIWLGQNHMDGLVWERRNSSALAMELCLSCINPSISKFLWPIFFYCWKLNSYSSKPARVGVRLTLSDFKIIKILLLIKCNWGLKVTLLALRKSWRIWVKKITWIYNNWNYIP